MPPLKILTEEEEKKICDLYQSGASFNQLYKRYGYTSPVAKRILKKAEILKRPIEEKVTKVSEIKQGQPIDCNKDGKKCIYKNKGCGKSVFLCDYCSITGNLRGGSPHECVKYAFKGGRK